MKATELLQCTDALTWAAEFERIKQEQGWTIDDINEGLMIGWFANAMCAMRDAIARKTVNVT